MTLGEWVLALFIVGTALTLAGALWTSWWLLGPGIVLVVASLTVALFEREADQSDDPPRWP